MMFFFQAEDGIRDIGVTGVQTCALPIFADREHMLNDDVFAAQRCADWLEQVQAYLEAPIHIRNLWRSREHLEIFYRAVQALSQTREVFGHRPVAVPPGTRGEPHFRHLSTDESLAYLNDFFPLVLKNYRALIERNLPR